MRRGKLIRQMEWYKLTSHIILQHILINLMRLKHEIQPKRAKHARGCSGCLVGSTVPNGQKLCPGAACVAVNESK